MTPVHCAAQYCRPRHLELLDQGIEYVLAYNKNTHTYVCMYMYTVYVCTFMHMCICTFKHCPRVYRMLICTYTYTCIFSMCMMYVYKRYVRTYTYVCICMYSLCTYDSVAGCSFTMVDVEGRTALHWTTDHTTDDALLAVLRAYPPLLNRRFVITCTIPHKDR